MKKARLTLMAFALVYLAFGASINASEANESETEIKCPRGDFYKCWENKFTGDVVYKGRGTVVVNPG